MGQNVVSDQDPVSNEDFEEPPPNTSYVKLPIKPTQSQIHAVQSTCNALIAQNLPITVQAPLDAKTASLPKDYDVKQGVVRVIHIEGVVDENPCRGTHLSSTAEIGTIFLYHTTPLRSTNTRFWFTTCDRAVRLANKAVTMVRGASAVMSIPAIGTGSHGVTELEAKVATTVKDAKDLRAMRRKVEAETAGHEAERVVLELDALSDPQANETSPKPSAIFVH